MQSQEGDSIAGTIYAHESTDWCETKAAVWSKSEKRGLERPGERAGYRDKGEGLARLMRKGQDKLKTGQTQDSESQPVSSFQNRL